MTEKQPENTDLNNIAMEACDLWQQHLSNLANDPTARAELTRFLEPQRRMFADWASMMKQGFAAQTQPRAQGAASASDNVSPNPTSTEAPDAAPASASSSAASGDDPLRVAQLALRVAELEKRVGQLEQRLSSTAE